MTKLNVKFVVENAQELWGKIRWNNTPQCKCGCTEYYATGDGRYKCKECGYVYSDTANTILQNSKLEKWQWLVAMYAFSVNKSISLRELANMIGVSNVTAWRVQQKLRKYMLMDKVEVSGEVMMDEAHIGGWSGMHLNKKMEYMRANNFICKNDKYYDKRAILAASSEKKHHILSIINKDNKCVIRHIKGQITKSVIRQIVKEYNITHIISDESKLYQGIKGVTVEQSNHSKHIFMTKEGHTSNACENRFSWVKRIINGYHTHTSEKYLQLYLAQIAFKINNKDLTPYDRFIKLGRLCCSRYISNEEVFNYDFTEGIDYPTNNNEELVNEILNSGLVSEVSIKSKRYYRK